MGADDDHGVSLEFGSVGERNANDVVGLDLDSDVAAGGRLEQEAVGELLGDGERGGLGDKREGGGEEGDEGEELHGGTEN